MSAVDLFNEMVILRDKIDQQMQMDIWPKLFKLLASDDTVLELPFDDLIDFLISVANASQTKDVRRNASMVSRIAAPGGGDIDEQATIESRPLSRSGVLNLFPSTSIVRGSKRVGGESEDLSEYRKSCQRLLQYYTLSSTSCTDFKIADLVMCMIYLAKSVNYRPLYALLKTSLSQNNECMPYLAPDQMFNLVELLRNLMDVPTATIDFNNIKLLKMTMNKVMNYPVTRFPRIMLLPNTSLAKDERCTIIDLFTERGEMIKKLESTQYMDALEDSRIPFCEDEEFINELLKITDNFSLPRMFFNATNSIFYTTMENYAIANCKFNLEDYNNIYRAMDLFKEMNNHHVGNEISDSLNLYLGVPIGSGSYSSSNLSKRK